MLLIKNFVSNILLYKKNILPKTFSRNYPAPKKRFYKGIHISEADGKFEICLDKHKLKTPLGNKFQLPNEALAVAVATEWDLQKDIIQQHNMHITALCNTAIDNPCKLSDEQLADDTVQFLYSDTTCYRSKEPADFALLQRDEWDPVLEWFRQRYNVTIDVCEDVSGDIVPESTILTMKKHLLSFNHWSLIGINFTVENLKSLILTMAVTNQVIDVEKAATLSRLETVFQNKHWGTIEWAHSVDEAQIKARVAAGVLFTYLNESSSDFTNKSQSKVKTLNSAKLYS